MGSLPTPLPQTAAETARPLALSCLLPSMPADWRAGVWTLAHCCLRSVLLIKRPGVLDWA